jgi:hypothetical protein
LSKGDVVLIPVTLRVERVNDGFLGIRRSRNLKLKGAVGRR